MNYRAFANDSPSTMYEVVQGALDADDTLKALGEAIRFRVRETSDWKNMLPDVIDVPPAPLQANIVRGGLQYPSRARQPRAGRE
jgi:hypothetical protein